MRIDSGTLGAGSGGTVRFGSDTFFTGGKTGTVAQVAQYGRAEVAKAIAGAEQSEVAITFPEGAFRYHIPLADGAYTVTLTFMEPKAKPGERRFDLDVVAAAEAPLTAVTRTFPVAVSGSLLSLEFMPKVGHAIVSSIKVVKK